MVTFRDVQRLEMSMEDPRKQAVQMRVDTHARTHAHTHTHTHTMRANITRVV